MTRRVELSIRSNGQNRGFQSASENRQSQESDGTPYEGLLRFNDRRTWTRGDLNPGPLPCEGSDLPLIYESARGTRRDSHLRLAFHGGVRGSPNHCRVRRGRFAARRAPTRTRGCRGKSPRSGHPCRR